MIYLYGEAAMDAVSWLLDHEIFMAVVLLAILRLAVWWFNTKKSTSQVTLSE